MTRSPMYAARQLRMPASLWAETAPAGPDVMPLAGDARSRVAIVGGGYTGLATALHLAERGGEPLLLDAAEPGFGGSGRNGGQVIPGLKLDPEALIAKFGENRGWALVDFAGGTADAVFELIRRHRIDCEARQGGWIQPAMTEAQLRHVYCRARQWRRLGGVEVRELDAEKVRRLTGTDAYLGGWVDPRGGTVQPLAYARGLARAAQRLGARVHGPTMVTALRREGDRWRLTTEGGEVTAEQVVLATNGYTGDLWPGLRRTVLPATSVQVATDPLPAEVRRHVLPADMPVSDARRLLHYLRLDAAGRFVFGGRGSFGRVEHERHFRRPQRIACRMFPVLEGVRWRHRWGGTVALTVDGLPHLHRPAPGLVAALGYNGRGVAMASRMGGVLADMASGTDDSELPLPVTEPRPVPFHGLRRPAMEAAAAVYRLLDRLGW